MDADPNAWVSLGGEEGVFLEGELVFGTVRLRHPMNLVRLQLELRWRVRGSGEAASEAQDIDLLEPRRDRPSKRHDYPFEFAGALDRSSEAPVGWYADAVFKGRASDHQRFELKATLIVLRAEKKGPEQVYR